MKSIALIASHLLIPLSVIAPVASTLSSYKNDLKARDAETKSMFLMQKGTDICNEIKNEYKNLFDWCMKEQKEGAGA